MINICIKNNNCAEDKKYQKHVLYSNGKCNDTNFTKKNRGISAKVKEIIEEIVKDYDARPKKIHVKLNKKKYQEIIDVMPSLQQIQTYIKNFRKESGNNNDLNEIKKLVEDLKYKEDL